MPEVGNQFFKVLSDLTRIQSSPVISHLYQQNVFRRFTLSESICRSFLSCLNVRGCELTYLVGNDSSCQGTFSVDSVRESKIKTHLKGSKNSSKQRHKCGCGTFLSARKPSRAFLVIALRHLPRSVPFVDRIKRSFLSLTFSFTHLHSHTKASFPTCRSHATKPVQAYSLRRSPWVASLACKPILNLWTRASAGRFYLSFLRSFQPPHTFFCD